jgi:hypothetical protein
MNAVHDKLAQRLKDLPLEEPEARVVSARVLRETRVVTPAPSRVPFRPRRFRLAAIAALLVASLPLAWGFLYFSPATAVALADAGGARGFSSFVLDGVGLGTGGSVTAQSSSASGPNFRVRLVGAYADPIRTVILVNLSPADTTFDATLRDQFGITYELHSGLGDLRTGDWAFEFSPASWLAAITGMRFTLDIRDVPMGFSIAQKPLTLRGIVLVNGGHELSTPAAGPIGQGHIKFGAVRYAGRVLAFDAKVSGIPDKELNQEFPKGSDKVALLIVLNPDDGGPGIMATSYGSSSSGGPSALSVYFVNVDPGTYVLSITIYGEGTLERTVVVS